MPCPVVSRKNQRIFPPFPEFVNIRERIKVQGGGDADYLMA
jgi:hypothetical protein